MKAVLLAMPKVLVLPRCELCGGRDGTVAGEWVVTTTRKKGYTLKERSFKSVCAFCHNVSGKHPLFVGMDLAIQSLDRTVVRVENDWSVEKAMLDACRIPKEIMRA